MLAFFKPLPKVGTYIKVISAPRRFDGADAFAGYTGKVIEADKDGVILESKTSSLIIADPGWRNRLKFKRISEQEFTNN